MGLHGDCASAGCRSRAPGKGGGGGKGEAPRSWSFCALLVAAFCRPVCT